MIECPKYNCPHEWTEIEALEAHLQWDHNQSEYEAARMVYEQLQENDE